MPQGPGPAFKECPEFFGNFGPPALPAPSQDISLCRQGFAVSFNPRTKNANWVIEVVENKRLNGPANRRGVSFKPDPDIPFPLQPSLRDFRGSGFDRGHLVPAADLKWSQGALNQSFFLTNVSPQVGIGFNRGIWRRLEEEVRRWAGQRGPLYVITGPVFYNFEPVIGPGRVVVPDGYFKIVFDPGAMEAVAFLLPNAAQKYGLLADFQVTVDAVESETGLDFFPELPDILENRLEAGKPEWR